jgi:enoyl-CoA hydratase
MLAPFENLLYDLEESSGILVITFNRPAKLNALNIATVAELARAIQEAESDLAVRGIIVTGNGEKAFVAGADIAEFIELAPGAARHFAERGQETLFLLERCTKPVVAAVNGFALGGGCELAMACHVRVASENARFGQPEVQLGIIPGYGGTQRLVQLVGKGKALELMMTGDQVKADEALRLGLVNHVVSLSELLPFSKALLGRILSKAPIAVSNVIKSVEAHFSAAASGYVAEASLFAKCCQTQDFREGAAAFLQKRPAQFQGK